MQISTKFTIAVHMLAYIALYGDRQKVTSEILSGSIQVNPVIIRRLLSQLKAFDIISVARGSGGTLLSRAPEKITFFDIYYAVEAKNSKGLFHFHENPNPHCPVGLLIHQALDDKLAKIQQSMEDEMKTTTLADVIRDMEINR